MFLDTIRDDAKSLAKLADLLNEFAQGAEDLLVYLGNRNKLKGRKLDQDILALELIVAFEAAGGKASVNGKGEGPFVRFLQTFYEHWPNKELRPVSAGALIKAARKERRSLKRSAPTSD